MSGPLRDGLPEKVHVVGLVAVTAFFAFGTLFMLYVLIGLQLELRKLRKEAKLNRRQASRK